LFEHDLFRKPLHTFRDLALKKRKEHHREDDHPGDRDVGRDERGAGPSQPQKEPGQEHAKQGDDGDIQRLQNIAHSSFPSPPLSNIIGDIAAIDTPKTVKATLMIVSMASMTFMRRSFS
jgi:hypothetical protein